MSHTIYRAVLELRAAEKQLADALLWAALSGKYGRVARHIKQAESKLLRLESELQVA